MKSFLFVLVVTFLGFTSSTEKVERYIVGGNDAAPGQFPYFVSIRYNANWAQGCGGGILNQRWILSVISSVFNSLNRF